MIQIGLLHSLTGEMAISEAALLDAELMAIDEINSSGGVLGETLMPFIEDGESNPQTFAQKAHNLAQQGVVSLFGCWQSSCRKAVRPVVERHNLLLWYPLQYEGLEQSPYIFYTGSCLNQQIQPAVQWLLQQNRTRFYLLGSNYIFPWTAHKLVKAQLEAQGGVVLGEDYIPLGHQSFEEILCQIQATQPDVIFNTLNGDSNLRFYRQFHEAGLKPAELPVMAVSVAEVELQSIGPIAAGHYGCWSYFQSLGLPSNHNFVRDFKNRFGENRVTSDPMEAAYSQLYLWKQSVETAQSFETALVRQAACGQTFEAPGGTIQIDAANHHVWKPCRIGQIQPDGQFKQVFETQVIRPLPWLGSETLPQEHTSVVLNLLSEVSDWIEQKQQLQAEIVERQTAQEQVHFLQQITQRISEAQDLNSALKVALQLICQTSGWVFGESWIPNHSLDFLEYAIAWYNEDSTLKVLFDESRFVKITLNAGLPGRVWQSQKTEWLYDIPNLPDSHFLRRDLITQAGLSTGVGIPVMDGQEVIAVLVFFMSHLTGNQSQQVELISTVALQIGSLFRRKKAEGALRSSLATNTALLKALPDWKFRFSLDGTIINAKSTKQAILPLSSQDYLGKNLVEVLPAEVAENFRTAIRQTQTTHELEVVEYQLYLSGKTHEFEARFSLSEENQVITIIRDITERKRAESEIQTALNYEKELSELKTRFIAMASHEFRTPLSTILSSSELLEHYRHKWSEEKSLSHLKRIQGATFHMRDMLEDVLMVSTAEAGKLKFNPSEINLVSFCQELIEEIQLSSQTHTIHFSSDCDYFMLQGDQKLLRQTFYNLLSNAIKYSPKEENIYFTINCSNEEAVIQVRDEGIGIPESDISKIFTAFDRASNVGNVAGTGLGLSIVKKAVDLHGGQIELKSELGQGSTFTIRLPAIKLFSM
jgi:urea ABC transporter urea binding protein